MSDAGYELVVPASHPMLAGHFPGEPIVPGAWLLAAVQRLASQWLQSGAGATQGAAQGSAQARIAGVRVAKFTHPVRPGQSCRVTFERATGGLRFQVRHGATSCATGTLALDTPVDTGPSA